MSRLRLRKPSSAMAVAFAALLVAVGGTAFAASKLVKGDKLIKKHSLSGNRLKNHTITGTQVNLRKLGKVPSAASADTAANAGNAANLGGQPPSAYAAAGHTIGGLVKVPGTAAGNKVTVWSNGSLTISFTCTKDASNNVSASLDATSSEAGWVFFANLVSAAGSRNIDAITPRTTPNARANVLDGLEATSSAGFAGLYEIGVNSLGTDCWYNVPGVY